MELLSAYLKYVRRLDRAGMLQYWRDVAERHTVSEVPPAYAGKLPPPCALVPKKAKCRSTTTTTTGVTPCRAGDGDGDEPTMAYVVNVVELVSPDELHRVVCIPCPQVGPRRFYEEVGAMLRSAEVVMLEGVPASHVHRMPPVLLLPMKSVTFPSVGMHHRFFDILRNNPREPPKLFPSAVEIGWPQWIAQATVPIGLRMLLQPNLVSGTKAEAKLAWGRLREVLSDETLVTRHPNRPLEDRHVTVALPWSTAQIVNLEASLLKLGYRISRQHQLTWMEQDAMGRSFLGLTGDDEVDIAS
jgi:hypothetical protein